MIDPVTALGVATTAFNVIKKGFEVGRDVESMAGDIGRWMGAVSDIKKSEEYAKNPPLFKKIVNSKSVEEEALQAFMAKQKAEEMRNELRELISWSKGPSAWQELVQMEVKIRKERQEAIYAQKERQRIFWEWVIGSALVIAGVGMLIGFIMFLTSHSTT